MRYGFHMSTRGATDRPDAIAKVAQACDRLGFDYFGVNDHVIVSAAIGSAYPYSADGSWAGAAVGNCLETLTTLGFVAATTERIRLLTSVIVIPHRAPVLAAKMLATVDVLSKGRLTVGVGVGWMREELEALGAPPYERRGAASDEYIDAFRALWAEDVAGFDGEFVNFENVMFAPKPVQRPGPPIWIGGEGPAARRRVARRGDGWYPVGANPQHPLDSLERFTEALADLHARVEKEGRDPKSIDVALYAPWAKVGDAAEKDGQRLPFTGSRETVLDDVGAFEAAGLGTLVLNLETPDADATVERCEAFAEAAGIG